MGEFAQVAAFVASLREQPGISAHALEFLILTAARTGETLGATWDEVDMGAKLWTIPAERMKGGKAHRVPLSQRAMDLLEALPRNGDLIFLGPKLGPALNINAPRKLLIEMGHSVTVHGFRSSFRDWVSDRTNFPSEVAEMALSHIIVSKSSRAYARSDLLEPRRRLMDAWASYCWQPASVEVGKVVALQGR